MILSLRRVATVGVLLILASGGGEGAWADEAPSAPSEPQTVAPAPPPASAAALDLRDRHMYFSAGFGPAIYQHGQPVALGPFGRNVDRYFGDSPETLASARSFRRLSLIGAPLYAVGLAALLTDLFVLSANSEGGAFVANHEPLVWGLIGGGAALGITGGILLGVGGQRLRRAVNRFNAFLINRVLPPGQQLDLQLFSDRSGAGAALRVRF